MAVQTATKPEGPTGDFEGDIAVNDMQPNAKMLASAASLPLLDEKNKKHTFKSLYEGKGRIIMIFIRHFFCGNCQEYTRTLSEELTPAVLSALPTPTSLIMIGCGAVELIPMYRSTTKTPFPIYADPTRKIYDVLGMTKTLSLGSKSPRYMRQPIYKLSFKSMLMALHSGRNATSGGDFWQVGGEFVFDADGTVSWCHRMRNTRDHAEMDELRKAIGMDSGTESETAVPPGKPIGSRRSMSGVSGGGLVRKLSDRRKSWRNSIGRGRRNDEANSSLPRSTMEKLKEEPGAPESDRDAALAKLTGGANEEHNPSKTNGTVPNGHPHEPAVDAAPHDGLANGSADFAANKVPANGSAVEPVPAVEESTANGSADTPKANGTIHGHTPFVQSLMNGSTEKTTNDLSSERTLSKSDGADISNGRTIEAENGTANGHMIEA